MTGTKRVTYIEGEPRVTFVETGEDAETLTVAVAPAIVERFASLETVTEIERWRGVYLSHWSAEVASGYHASDRHQRIQDAINALADARLEALA